MRSWSVDMAVKKGMEKDNILAENGNSKVTVKRLNIYHNFGNSFMHNF